MYRHRTKYSRKLKTMREAKDRKRLDGPAPEYPRELPELRRRIVITDFDFGEVVHTIDCYRSNRSDCYRVEIDSKPWKERVGWSRILEAVRKGFIRVSAGY